MDKKAYFEIRRIVLTFCIGLSTVSFSYFAGSLFWNLPANGSSFLVFSIGIFGGFMITDSLVRFVFWYLKNAKTLR